MKEPKIETTAKPPADDRHMRSSQGMNSTMRLSNISPRSDGSHGSQRISPRLLRSQTRAAEELAKKKMEEEAKQKLELDKVLARETSQNINIDSKSGMQIMENELEQQLTFNQRLQLRIAKERKINLDNLKGEEYQILKDYKKMEERKEMLNNLHDFFEPRFDIVQHGIYSS